MQAWFAALAFAGMPSFSNAQPVLDFSGPAASAAFRVVNDGVMGGLSSSRLSVAGGALAFEGVVSLQNNGGFASFRGPVSLPDGSSALLVTVRGDGQRYKLTLKRDDSNAGPQYQSTFTAPREWTTQRFVPADFAASFRGRAVVAPALVFQEMGAVGILISDRQAGAFRIEIRTISAQ